MAAGVAGVLLEAPADYGCSPPVSDLICDYQQYLFFSPPPLICYAVLSFVGRNMSSEDCFPGFMSPEDIFLQTRYITTAIPEQARAT